MYKIYLTSFKNIDGTFDGWREGWLFPFTKRYRESLPLYTETLLMFLSFCPFTSGSKVLTLKASMSFQSLDYFSINFKHYKLTVMIVFLCLDTSYKIYSFNDLNTTTRDLLLFLTKEEFLGHVFVAFISQ